MTAEVLQFNWAVIARERSGDVDRLSKEYHTRYFDFMITSPNKYYLVGAYSEYCQKHFSVPWMYVTDIQIEKFFKWLDKN